MLGRRLLAVLSLSGAAVLFAACFFPGLAELGECAGGACEDAAQRDTAAPPVADATPPTDGAQADAGPPSDGAPSGCPTGMVRVDTYCIDATEVTEGEWDAFRGALDVPKVTTPECAWKNDVWNPPFRKLGASFPVTGVDWCDAYAFCKWKGKRLCGKVGGGANTTDAEFTAQTAEWVRACNGGNAGRGFQYGADYDAAACHESPTPLAVGTKPTCQGPTPGLFDMNGNVGEWDDSCDPVGADARASTCRFRPPGAFGRGANQCTFVNANSKAARDGRTNAVGLRCCSG